MGKGYCISEMSSQYFVSCRYFLFALFVGIVDNPGNISMRFFKFLEFLRICETNTKHLHKR
jgi:hypothetical protein